ncbi:MAG: hypothetical protein ACE5R6_18200 [Candidatus Heimdallarchaeota archaeon]
MNSSRMPSYKATFKERTIWAEIKEEFKQLLQRHEIRYTDTVEVPIFTVEYVRRTDKAVKIIIQWPPEGNLIVQVHTDPLLLTKDKELQQTHAEIFEFLQIWGAKFEELLPP